MWSDAPLMAIPLFSVETVRTVLVECKVVLLLV